MKNKIENFGFLNYLFSKFRKTNCSRKSKGRPNCNFRSKRRILTLRANVSTSPHPSFWTTSLNWSIYHFGKLFVNCRWGYFFSYFASPPGRSSPPLQVQTFHTLKLRPIFKKSDPSLKVVPMDSYRSRDTKKVVFEIGKIPAHGQNCILIFFTEQSPIFG